MTAGIVDSRQHTSPRLAAAATVIGIALYFALPALAAFLTYRVLGLTRGSHLAASVEFFV